MQHLFGFPTGLYPLKLLNLYTLKLFQVVYDLKCMFYWLHIIIDFSNFTGRINQNDVLKVPSYSRPINFFNCHLASKIYSKNPSQKSIRRETGEIIGEKYKRMRRRN